VLAKFPGYGDRYFKAEIFGKYRGKYNLYYLDDGAELKGVDEGDLLPPDLSKKLLKPSESDEWAAKSRCDYLKKPFKSEQTGPGTWHATSVGKRNHVNKFICERVKGKKGDKPVRLDVFDVYSLIDNTSS
jgi:hypothetical protein